ncbi:PD-(D/E)XK nuclease family protein [Lawsonibacter sp. JLR.KK007]|uniref:PD-(D/E)XK nuclease family protein n=1 Tax=Lawsonibacter sp. JLR.KK007 TaxID=3114293 RepID=UPI002FEFD053
MFKLLLGRAGSGKTTAVLDRMCRAGRERPQVLLVPEQQSHETERALCAAGGPQASLYAEVLSFSRLSSRIFQMAGGLGVEELEPGGRLLLMYRAVQNASPKLTVYSRPSRRPSFLTALLATADELKSCCVSPELLIRAGEEAPGPEGDKLRDLGLIFGEYEALTAQTALDPRDRLTRAAEKLRSCGWARGKDLWLDGFTDFTPQQGELLRLLMVQSESMTVTLTCDHLEEDEGGTGIFSPARRTANTLLRLAKEERVPCEVERLAPSATGKAEPLVHLEGTLFAEETPAPVPCGGAVELFQAASPRSEVEWTAARILQLVREENLRFRDIGVAARSYGTYQDLVESVFGRYGVPVFSSAMTDILEKPVLALVTAALDITAGDTATMTSSAI